jgi:hypothetical protein
MKSLKTWRVGLLLVVMAGLLTASELKGAPRVTIENPTALYLLAQYKLAVGDTGSGLELLDRAMANHSRSRQPAPPLRACSASLAIATP